ncbi:MAG: BadF/BadG/BcrA/BcrD ATPase family protein [Ktedonobacteraceae bacterium]
MQCVLAVDGGNTKTIAFVAALDGTILGSGRGGCGDIHNASRDGQHAPDEALSNVEHAVLTALQNANRASTDLVTGVFNMAGADWPEDFAFLQSVMEKRGFGSRILVQNDALGVLHASTIDNVGVSIVCGTGAATGARGPDGRVWHSSFWQIDAEGSIDLSRKTLAAVFRSELGIDQPTTLRERVLDYYKLKTVEEVLYYLTKRENRALQLRRTDTLTPIVLEEAEAGDAIARQIVQEHGRSLGNYAIVAAQKVGIEKIPFTLVLAGGVFRNSTSILADAIIARVRIASPQAQPTRARFEPIVGVLFTALEMAGTAINSTLLDRLVPTIPDAKLFETTSSSASQL